RACREDLDGRATAEEDREPLLDAPGVLARERAEPDEPAPLRAELVPLRDAPARVPVATLERRAALPLLAPRPAEEARLSQGPAPSGRARGGGRRAPPGPPRPRPRPRPRRRCRRRRARSPRASRASRPCTPTRSTSRGRRGRRGAPRGRRGASSRTRGGGPR